MPTNLIHSTCSILFCHSMRACFFVVNLDCAVLNNTYLVLETLTEIYLLSTTGQLIKILYYQHQKAL